MGNYEICLRTRDRSLVCSLVNDQSPEGITLTFEEILPKGIIDGDDVALVVITALSSIPASLLAQWLWSKIKGMEKSATNIFINDKSVTLNFKSIYTVLQDQRNNQEEDKEPQQEDRT